MIRSACGALPLILMFAPLLAAQDAPKAPSQRTTQLEEIVVTAQKKKELLQDTPISMAAFTDESLEKMGVENLGDVAGFVPNVDITPFPNSRSSLVVFMRGVGNNDSQTTQDPAVGVYIDGVYLGRTVGLTSEVADLARVEVLRGPQGTLYGRNTTGGAINMITAKPNGLFGVRQVVGMGNRGHMLLKSRLDTPMWHDLAARISLIGSARDGLVNNIDDGPDFAEQDKRGARVSLSWNPDPALTVDYAWDTSEDRGPQQFYQVLRINEDNADLALATQALLQQQVDELSSGGITPPQELVNALAGLVVVNGTLVPQFRERASESRLSDGEWFIPVEDSVTEVSGHTLTAAWNTGLGEFKSISAWRELNESVVQDYGAGVEWFDVAIQIDHQQLSQELQWLGGNGANIDFVSGLYFFEEDGVEHEVDVIAGSEAENRTIWSTNRAYAAYGQLTWTPRALPSLDVTLGGRYTVDEREARKTSINFEESPDNTQFGAERWSNFTPSVTLNWRWSDTLSTWVKGVTGYKSGGFNVRSTEQNFLPPYDEEQMVSYELGFKSNWWANRLQLNGAAFYSGYEDMQIQQILDNSKIFLTDVFNAGESRVAGFELDLVAVPLAGLNLALSYGYTDAEFTRVIDNNPDSDSFGQDVSAIYTMPYAPEQTWSATIDYQFPRWLSFAELSAWLSYRWRDERYGTASNPDMAGFHLDQYGLLDARLSLSDMQAFDLDIDLAIWGRNLMDEEYLVHSISQSYFHAGTFGEPRTYGLELSVAF